MVADRRCWNGTLPLARMTRLAEVLADTDGELEYTLEFGCGELETDYLDVQLRTSLTLQCQRTLQPFALPVTVNRRLGLIRDDREEASLPPDYAPLLVVADRINPGMAMEDELLLAVPLVPVSPRSEWPEQGLESRAPDAPDEPEQDNPFAVLRELKSK